MQVQNLQSQAFQSQQRFLPQTAHAQAKELLNKMNAQTKYVEDGMRFSSDILSMLKIGADASFFDKRCLVRPVKDRFVGESDLEFDKVKLTFDNKTGEITKYKKPFFKSWKKIMTKAGEIIQKAYENFGNKECVEERFIGINGVTEKGFQKIEEAKKKAFSKR